MPRYYANKIGNKWWYVTFQNGRIAAYDKRFMNILLILLWNDCNDVKDLPKEMNDCEINIAKYLENTMDSASNK